METDGAGALTIHRPGLPQIDASRCSGCGRCVAACPEKIISLEVDGYRKHAEIVNIERCTSCGRCLLNCPVEAIDCIYS
jgi:ferredoxin